MSLTKLARMFVIAFWFMAIAFGNYSASADTVKSDNVDAVQKAAQEVVKDTGVKEQFGQSQNGNQLIDQAQQKANTKLNKIAAEQADSKTELPDSKQLFLDNLTE